MVLLAALPLCGQGVPAELPDPDGKPGDATKPVQVYLLAGQSNMVGMGDLSGARNVYDGVFYSSDPRVPDGPLPIYRVGNYRVAPLTVYRQDGGESSEPLAKGQFQVPQHGVYRVHCGSGENANCVMQVDGEAVYRRAAGAPAVTREVTMKPGQRYAFEITGFQGDAPRFWLEKTDLLGNGDLQAVAVREGKFPWLTDADGGWTVRNDVYFQEARVAKDGKGSPLSATSNGKSIGPELGFGHVLGTYHDEQVLLIKTAMGNRALGFDFRPPSSGRTDPTNKFESLEYQLMVEGVRKTLDKIDQVVPGYQGQGYELAGFVWFQGHKDSFSGTLIATYEQNLVNLINDVRREWKAPKMPAVIATVGFGGHNMSEKFLRILQAQQAVSDPQKHPEFAGTVATVDTRDFWREVDESPVNQDYHYHRNAETYMLIGDALGRAMVGLLGGKAEPLPQVPRPERAADAQAPEPTEEEKRVAQQALKPILLDGIAAAYMANPRYQPALQQEVRGERPGRANQFLRGALYGLGNIYRAAGVDDYEWRPFGPDLDQVQWDYFSFDPPETQPIEQANRYRTVTYPAGMADWTSVGFDARRAGWKQGRQPFGQLGGKLAPLSDSCNSVFCRCGETPQTLWGKEVLMVRGKLTLPPLKDGYRYRIIVGGATHVASGEGYAIYLNGKQLAESKVGVGKRQGGQPRGAHIYHDVAKELRGGGEVTLAVTSFLRYNHPRIKPYPPRGHLTLRLEEQKLPVIP